MLVLIILGRIFAGSLANHDPSGFYLQNLNDAPCAEFKFGTDSMGRDIYSMMWYGGRVSLAIGLIGAAIIAVIGTVFGSISGTANERIDSVMMRFTECGKDPVAAVCLDPFRGIQCWKRVFDSGCHRCYRLVWACAYCEKRGPPNSKQ